MRRRRPLSRPSGKSTGSMNRSTCKLTPAPFWPIPSRQKQMSTPSRLQHLNHIIDPFLCTMKRGPKSHYCRRTILVLCLVCTRDNQHSAFAFFFICRVHPLFCFRGWFWSPANVTHRQKITARSLSLCSQLFSPLFWSGHIVLYFPLPCFFSHSPRVYSE
jgi:hypothetical protein